jgi:2,3-bisphosphoglycerate-independent phosphoglycerate mutase
MASAKELCTMLKGAAFDTSKLQVVVCPVALQIGAVAMELEGSAVKVACQNISATATGAFTGEVAATMLADYGIEWCLIGHSERRTLYGETDEVCAKKIEQAQANGIKVIFCIGETLAEREAGETDAVCARQMKAVFGAIKDWDSVVISYEPVWAIGTGKVATKEQAQDAHAAIRAYIAKEVSPLVAEAVRIQYGGSVSAKNCAELSAMPDVDGFLVGGASLKPEFANILAAAEAECTAITSVVPLPTKSPAKIEGPLTLIVLDGYGIGKEYEGNCVFLANPENLTKYTEEAKANGRFAEILAHGTAVGLPDDTDMGNSEVGHNALGSGQWISQGSSLVNDFLTGPLFDTQNWKNITGQAKSTGSTVHLMGLLSDGGVHSNINHLFALIDQFAAAGIKTVRVHALTDGRDVPVHSSEKYVPMLEEKLAATGMDYKVASGGGRMYVTMDRYDSEWNIVKRGWDSMVHGSIDAAITPELGTNGYTGMYTSMSEWRTACRECFPDKNDQTYPPFVVVDESGAPIGKVKDGDIFINTNFRGDRALEISRCFMDPSLKAFDRGVVPNAEYYGMLIYDNDVGIPKKALCPNPDIKNVLSEYMIASGVSMYAVSETHKYGHVTFFWNGNRSGYLNESMEKYEEVPSDPATPEQISAQPAMKCVEITDKLVAALEENKQKFYRINYPNPDMCGHTGLIEETTQSIVTMDAQVKRVVDATLAKNGAVMVMADHGNCEVMIDKKGGIVTSHTTNPVPFFLIDPSNQFKVDVTGLKRPALTNVAASVCSLLGFESPAAYERTMVTA